MDYIFELELDEQGLAIARFIHNTNDKALLGEMGHLPFEDRVAEDALALSAIDESDNARAFWRGYFEAKAIEKRSGQGFGLQVISYHIYEQNHWLKATATEVFNEVLGKLPESIQWILDNPSN
jgi:hypothetical protein